MVRKPVNEVHAHAQAVMRHAHAQVNAMKNFPTKQHCMFTSLTDEKDSYVDGYEVFFKSLLYRNPGFNYPVLVMEKLRGREIRAKTKKRLLKFYAKTFFLTPLEPPFVPYKKHFRFQNGALGRQFSDESDTNMFYQRLQLFTYSFCRSVVHVDAGDMLVLENISELFQSRLTRGPGFAAAPLCERPDYFNAGLFVVGEAYLSARAYQEIISVAINLPVPSIRAKRAVYQWQADQDVLNVYFSLAKFRCISFKFNYSKRNVFGGRGVWIPSKKLQTIGFCTDISHPRIVHYVGPKPWMPIYKRERYVDKDHNMLQLEMYWWRTYFSDKSIVVSGGPTLLAAPSGPYIDMFKNVMRVDNFDVRDRRHTGARTTHAFIHMATRPANLSGIPKKNIFFSPFELRRDQAFLQRRVSQPTGTKLNLREVTMVSSKYNEELVQRMGLAPKKHPLMATVAVTWALRELRRKPVFVAGLDYLFDNSMDYTRYIVRETLESFKRYHDIRAEREYFQYLARTGRIRQLRVY